jgi:hypothetical protein
VFIGDSITDGFTYPLLFRQALYAQLALIVIFAVILKWRGRRLTEAAKV